MAEMIWLDKVRKNENSIVTVGTFDGVHAGHRVLIRTVVEKAEEKNCRSVVVTFDPHPRDIINPGREGIRLLTSLSERRQLLADIGIDQMVVIPFDRDFSLLSSEEFVRDVVWDKIGVNEFVIGYDHQFGRNRKGTIETVQAIGEEAGFDVYVVSRQEVGDQVVSSTVIRNLIEKEGDMIKAESLLTRSYLLNGTVVHGDKKGKQLGFPTANIQPDHPNKIIPLNGVYAVEVLVEEKLYGGMINIGIRPTFEKDEKRIEVHIFDFDREIYGNTIQIRFLERLRSEKSFGEVKELKKQLELDREKALKLLKNRSRIAK